jgi:hypothetical protein
MLILSYEVNLAVSTAKISFQNVISFVQERICRKPFTCATQTLTRRLFWLICFDRIFLQEITLSSGNTLFRGTSCNLPAPVTRIYHCAFDYKRLDGQSKGNIKL